MSRSRKRAFVANERGKRSRYLDRYRGEMMHLAATRQLVRWLDELGRITDEPERLTRTFLSPAMRRANAWVAARMREAGLAVREDAFGNVIGRLEPCRAGRPRPAGEPETRTLLLGSHLDTVRDAGRFDGALGVLLPIVALGELRRRGVELPFAVEVVGFSEEEGVRFSSAYLGSKGYTGQLRAADLALRDADGLSVRDALARWREALPAGADPLSGKRKRARRDLLGYVEVHIEQGPVLEAQDLAVGVVSAIAGQTRGWITFRGRAGHPGTTPMTLRCDALAGAAEFVSRVEAIARERAPLVATVGDVKVSPGAPNVIPGEVRLSLDVRHPREVARRGALRAMLAEARRIARRRGLHVEWRLTQDNDAVGCSRALSRELDASVRAVQGRSVSLVSGAGHDGVVVSAIAPIAMLFVRCRGGVSHHPDEYVAPADLDVALRVTMEFLQRVGRVFAPPLIADVTGRKTKGGSKPRPTWP